jgi:hypothetical protein
MSAHQPGVREVEAEDVTDPLPPANQVEPKLVGERTTRGVRVGYDEYPLIVGGQNPLQFVLVAYGQKVPVDPCCSVALVLHAL